MPTKEEFKKASLCRKAIIDGDMSKFKALLSGGGLDVNYADGNGSTFLHLAVACGRNEMVDVLISDSNIDVNKQDKEGNTPLHLAVNHKSIDIEIVESLLKNEKLRLLKDVAGHTPIYLALQNDNKSKSACKLLIAKRNEISKNDVEILIKGERISDILTRGEVKNKSLMSVFRKKGLDKPKDLEAPTSKDSVPKPNKL